MKKMTKWLAVCAVCVMGSVPAMATDGSGHCWAEIGGRVYDPLFAEAKSYYGYSGVGYGSYGSYPERRVAV